MKSYKIGYTHAGCFHYDDVLSAVFLKRVFKGIKIIRINKVTDEMRNDENAIIFDIGKGLYDGHKINKSNDSYGNKKCTFALLWDAFADMYLEGLGFKCIKACKKAMYENYIQYMDEGESHGYMPGNPLKEEMMVRNFNPRWYELKDNPGLYDEKFEKACVCVDSIFQSYIDYIYEYKELREKTNKIWKNAERYHHGQIVLLEKAIDWRDYAFRDDNISMILTKSDRGGYMLKFKHNKYMHYNEFIKFIPDSGKMAICDTKEDAIKAAKILVDDENTYRSLMRDYRYW